MPAFLCAFCDMLLGALAMGQRHQAATTIDYLDTKGMIKAVDPQVTTFRDIIFSDISLARQGLRKILDGPICFIPTELNEDRFYSFEGKLKLGAILRPVGKNVRYDSARGHHIF